MIEKRPTKRTLEEVVAQHELPRQAPQVQGITALGVIAHGQATRVGPGTEHVVLAAVDLHLVLVEHVPQIAGHQAQRQLFTVRAFERIRAIGQPLLILGAHRISHPFDRLRAQLQYPAPSRGQDIERGTVAITLLEVFWVDGG